jgi:hypothetical protein
MGPAVKRAALLPDESRGFYDNLTMRTLAVIFVMALITIAFEISSDAALTRSEFSRAAPDPAAVAVANALKRR